MAKTDYPFNVSSLGFVENLYADYLANPESVPENWRQWFEAQAPEIKTNSELRLAPNFSPPRLFNAFGTSVEYGEPRREASRAGVSLAAVQQ